VIAFNTDILSFHAKEVKLFLGESDFTIEKIVRTCEVVDNLDVTSERVCSIGVLKRKGCCVSRKGCAFDLDKVVDMSRVGECCRHVKLVGFAGVTHLRSPHPKYTDPSRSRRSARRSRH